MERERAPAGSPHGGRQLGFRATLGSGKRVIVHLRLPAGMELVDVVSLARRSPRVPANGDSALAAIERAQRIPGVVAVGALRRDHVPEAERESLATLTVTFTELDGPLDVDRFVARESPGTITARRDLVQLSDGITRFERLSVESLGDGDQRLRVL
ncbi:MAG: hypothetical protein J2P43_13100, partial [Candidatus Dormibacteraeota bacterium]|nr:hypothetical protein [Candidatus Dormibacteraeota bacterium]